MAFRALPGPALDRRFTPLPKRPSHRKPPPFSVPLRLPLCTCRRRRSSPHFDLLHFHPPISSLAADYYHPRLSCRVLLPPLPPPQNPHSLDHVVSPITHGHPKP